MRLETVIKREFEAINRIRDIYSAAKHFGPTSDETNRDCMEVIAKMGKVPRYAQTYVNGYRKALTDSLYENTLVYGAFINGVFYSTHSKRPDYYQKHGIEPAEFAKLNNRSGHYWVLESGKIKPYFVLEN